MVIIYHYIINIVFDYFYRLAGISTKGQANTTTSRAIQKSPIYINVGSYQKRPDNKIEFILSVSLKDGRYWNIGRTYTDFLSLRASMPLGSCNSFDNRFPLPLMTTFMKLFSQEPSDEAIEKKRLHNNCKLIQCHEIIIFDN